MVRLFSALELPADIHTELADRVRALRAADPDLDSGLTWTTPDRWHITLGFYGDREHLERRGAWFRRQVTGLPPTRLRLRGAGRFPGVLWVGVNPMESRDLIALRTLAGALNADNNADRYAFTAHVTIARWRRGASGSERAIRAVHTLSDFAGAWWPVTEVVLFRSDLATDGSGGPPVYTPLDRVPLASKQG
ncbi:RNA 2',3'-cyclic phosphodiesterase [Actinophytocola sediminis]